jgi:hypothetical protein
MALRPGMDKSAIKRWLAALLISKPSFWLLGFLSGLALLIEEPRRRAELTMYVLPKALESAWAVARGRGLVRGGGKVGQAALAGAGMGMVMTIYQVSRHAFCLWRLGLIGLRRMIHSICRGW